MRIPSAALSAVIGAMGRTWRVSVTGGEHLKRLRSNGTPFIFALWHAQLLPLVWLHRGFPTALVVSRHRDGRYLAATAVRWGYRIIDGSSRHGGVRALRHMMRVLETGGEVAVTPDGPRGPAGSVKPGLLSAAQRTGAVILPVGARASSSWRLNSWDRFMIPKPFASVGVSYGNPLEVRDGSDGMEEARRILEGQLDGLVGVVRCG